MLTNKAYKYRIYPNSQQKELLSKQFGACRFVYNYFLRQRIDAYANTGKGLVYHDTSRLLTDLKKTEAYSWLNSVDSQAIQQSLRDLDVAYNKFFNKQSNFPRFKKKMNQQSCRFPQRFRIEGGKLRVPKVGWVEIVCHRPMSGRMKNLTISKTESDKYFASIVVEEELVKHDFAGNVMGIDLGLKDFVVLSNGDKFDNPKYLHKSEKKLKRLHKRLSKTQNGSNGREKARQRLARQHEKVANQRKDFLNKLSRKLIDENQVIVIEDLNVNGMVKNRKLAKSILDAGWYEFVRQLTYKGNWYGCHVHKIDRFFPSSKRCNECGFINHDLKLSDRTWICPECSSDLDRDINAAKNILTWYTAGAAEINAYGQDVRLSESSLDEVGNA